MPVDVVKNVILPLRRVGLASEGLLLLLLGLMVILVLLDVERLPKLVVPL